MALDQDIALLSRIPLFAAVGEEALRLVAFSAETRVVRSGDVLFREGQPADGGYVILEGAFGLADQGGLTPGQRIGAGALIGEIALIVDATRPATATALEPSSVMRIPRALFRRVLAEYPQAARAAHSHFRARIDATSAELLNVRRAFVGEG